MRLPGASGPLAGLANLVTQMSRPSAAELSRRVRAMDAGNISKTERRRQTEKRALRVDAKGPGKR